MNTELEVGKAMTRRRQRQQKSQRFIFRLFSPYWLACIPLAAIIVVVWNTAAFAQGGGFTNSRRNPGDSKRHLGFGGSCPGNFYECRIWDVRNWLLPPEKCR